MIRSNLTETELFKEEEFEYSNNVYPCATSLASRTHLKKQYEQMLYKCEIRSLRRHTAGSSIKSINRIERVGGLYQQIYKQFLDLARARSQTLYDKGL